MGRRWCGLRFDGFGGIEVEYARDATLVSAMINYYLL